MPWRCYCSTIPHDVVAEFNRVNDTAVREHISESHVSEAVGIVLTLGWHLCF